MNPPDFDPLRPKPLDVTVPSSPTELNETRPPDTSAFDETKPTPSAGRVAEFEILSELARGGMGVVYIARDPSLGRRVALKMILPGRARPHDLERFAIEARAAGRLRHPNIVAIHRVGEHNGQPCMVQELIEGESLKSRLKRDGPLGPREAARMAQKLASALYYAHTQSILHRDMKPSNVLLSAGDEPVITDFGLAKDVTEEKGITQTGQTMGTPAYMPPEQADGQLDRIDRRADIYSLGATLYEMLTGQPPFQGASLLNVIHAVLTKAPAPLRQLRPELDRDLETICLKCLEKEIEQRYGSAEELADELGRYLRDEPILAKRPSLPRRAWKWTRRNWKTARLMAATLALCAVGLGGALEIQRRAQAAEALEAVDEARASALALDPPAVLKRAEEEIAQVVADEFAKKAPSLSDADRRSGLRAQLQELADAWIRVIRLSPADSEALEGHFEALIGLGRFGESLQDYGLAELAFKQAGALDVSEGQRALADQLHEGVGRARRALLVHHAERIGEILRDGESAKLGERGSHAYLTALVELAS